MDDEVGLAGDVQDAGVTTFKVRLLEMIVPSAVTDMFEIPATLPGVIVAV